jgi:glutathione synthase/RimK-type ligase-like ATP-grasp enzyme
MNTKKIFILVDYRDTFYSSTKEIAGSMDIAKVKMLFERQGYDVKIEKFSDVNFRSEKYNNSFVLYQSSEDPDLRYKDYIEDVLIGLELIGAVLIPDFYKFRAHHNKIFMEILRDVGGCNLIQNITSKKYGTLEELAEHIDDIVLPAVVKQGAGSRSCGISLCNSTNEVLDFAKRISRSFSLTNFYRFIGGIWSGKGYKPISNFRKKFVVQNFIDSLSYDYKILVYMNKFYVLQRQNRRDDFRASGSGKLSFPEELPGGLLDYVESIFTFFNAPFGSFDVAVKDNEFYLLEFQFLSFGQYALEKSTFFFRKNDSCWNIVREVSDLEENFVRSICLYIDKYLTLN